jgi:peptidoglycan LD-endopeptidase LytH
MARMMSKAALWAIILLTALVTFVVTSAFWVLAYNWGRQQPDEVVITETAPAQAPAELVLGPGGLVVPVEGVSISDLVDTYTQSRAGGARVHNAIDIMAPHGTPVLAAAAGTVERLFYSRGGGGITAYIRSEDGQWIYYYAHLQEYAPGLAEGQRVEQGQQIGTVGSTGNASPDGPHLHFAVHRMGPGDRWHGGTPVNPFPLLAGEAGAR